MRPAASFTECPRLSARSGCGALAICIAPFVLIACCAAQEAPATYPVDGVVENIVTHQPIARALVESNATGVLTDNEGRFELNLPAGVAYLGVRRPGFGGEVPGRPSVQQRVTVSAKTPPVTIFLTP